jgi:hypothetical protein
MIDERLIFRINQNRELFYSFENVEFQISFGFKEPDQLEKMLKMLKVDARDSENG